MKYGIDMEIDVPLDKVIELFDNPDNLKEWQPGLVSFEHLSGTPGEVGAKSKLLYKMGKKDVEMIETITERNLPEMFSGTYDAKGVHNEIWNRFVAIDENRTRWEFKTEFQVEGFMMKLMVLLMPFMFKSQSRKFMQNFKEFAEREHAGSA